MNSMTSYYFSLHRGTRQGCLSLFLFDLAIKPLAITLGVEERISGVTGFNKIHKVSLYADDLLLFLSNQQVLIDILHQYGKISGYKFNFSKSTLPINQFATSADFSSFPLVKLQNLPT